MFFISRVVTFVTCFLSLTKCSKVLHSDYLALRNDIKNLVVEKNCAPILLRLAWHDSGTYCKHSKTGGSRGCMRFNEGESTYDANNGLNIARDLLQNIVDTYTKKSFSVADIWTLAGAVAIETSGGPKINYRLGRVDAKSSSESTPDGRLPDASQGLSHLRDIFNRMGFNDREIVALSGAHTLGSCHLDRSGFSGPWTSDPYKFDNSYFTDLVNKKWVNKKNKNGNIQLEEYNSSNDLMMLNTDYAIFNELDTRPIVEEYAKNEEAFFKDFADAFKKLIELGYSDEQLYFPNELKKDL